MAHMTLLEELSAGRLSRKAQECAFEKKRESEFHGSCDGQNVNVTGHVAKQGKVSEWLGMEFGMGKCFPSGSGASTFGEIVGTILPLLGT